MTQWIVTYYYLRNMLSREGGCSCNRDSEECMEEKSKQAEKLITTKATGDVM